MKNIVIIGGSHSGFSAAWMMLNGPATFNRNNSINSQKWKSMPDAVYKSIPSCPECCACKETKKGTAPKCNCVCKCFGYFKYEDWEFDESLLPKHFENANIKIIYRDKIRVFYGTVIQAQQDGYHDFNENIYSNK